MRIHGLRAREREVGSGVIVVRFAEAVDHDGIAARLAGVANVAAQPGRVEIVAGEWIAPRDEAGVEAQRWVFEEAGGVEVWCVLVDHERGSWKFEAPPRVRGLGCPVEGFPQIVQEWDPEDFGIAVKLGGEALVGEGDVVRAFHSFWLAPYSDSDVEVDSPYRHAGVEIDAVHRSALLWVDRFFVPVTGEEAVEHLLWVVQQLAEVIPVVHARFAVADMSIKYGALFGEVAPPFVLAGNPLRERFHRDGETAAFSWAESQRVWSRRELAAMLAELVTEHDPTQPDTNEIALRLCERGIALDPEHPDLAGYRMQLLVERGRVGDAVEHARPSPVLLAHLVGLVAERAPARLDVVLDALDGPVLAAIAGARALVEQQAGNVHSLGRAVSGPSDLVQPLVLEVATHVPGRLAAILDGLPRDAALCAQLHAAAHRLEGAVQMQVFDALLALPRPAREDEGAWTDWLRAVNNACIHAHARGDFTRACEIAELAQDVAADNPYIFHSAACAYAAAGDPARALQQVEFAVRHRYEHLDKLRVDADLGALLEAPEFLALFGDP